MSSINKKIYKEMRELPLSKHLALRNLYKNASKMGFTRQPQRELVEVQIYG